MCSQIPDPLLDRPAGGLRREGDADSRRGGPSHSHLDRHSSAADADTDIDATDMDGNHPTNPRANRHRHPVTLTQPNPSADRHAHSRADRDTHRDIAATHTLTRALGNAVTIRPATNSAGPTPQRCQRAAQPLL